MKKISIIISIIVMIISLIPMRSSAVEPVDTVKIYSKGLTDGLLVRDGITRHTYIAVYKKDGKEYPAYCLNRELPGVEEGPQTVKVNELVTNVMVWRVLINGYPYKTLKQLGCNTEAEAYLATKQAIYCVLEGIDVNSYKAVDSDAGRRTLKALKKIVANAKKSTVSKVSSALTINQENSVWRIDKLDSKYVSRTFSVKANAGFDTYTVSLKNDSIEGIKIADENNKAKKTFKPNEKFKILIPITNILKSGSFTINVAAKVNTKPVLYGKSTVSGLQNYAMTGYTYEDGTGSKSVNYSKNDTRIVIVKKEETSGKVLQGVEFEVLDGNKNQLYAGLKTNSKGQIQIDNLLPGIYYIRETKTLDGYQIYDKLIKVDLELNEKATVQVINSKEPPEIHIENKESETSVSDKKSEISVENKKEEVSIDNNKTEISIDNEDKNINIDNNKTETNINNKDENINVNNNKTDINVDNKDKNVNIDNNKTDVNIDNKDENINVDNNKTDINVDNKDTNINVDNNKTDVNIDNKNTNVNVDNNETGINIDNKDTNVNVDNNKTDISIDNQDTQINVENNKQSIKLPKTGM